MHMKAVGEDRHVEMEADYKPAEDIWTSCGNNSNARANAWVDDLTGRLQRPLKKDFTICRVNRVVLSGSNAQLTTRPAMMMVVGKKQAENRGIRCNCFKLS